MGYFFVETVIDFVQKSKFDFENYKSNRALFRKFNFQENKSRKHLANMIYRDDESKVIAIRCNCGRKTYHPVQQGNVLWDEIISPESLFNLKSKILKN